MVPKNKHFSLLNNEQGFALLSSMIFLVILTVIGIAITNTSNIETMISAAEKNKQKSFFAAEAGIEHGKTLLMNKLASNFQTTSVTNWNFALSDTEPGVESTDSIGNSDGINESFTWITDKAIGTASTYSVMVRDNDDDTDIFNDSDNIIILTSRATMTDGTFAGIEVSISGVLSGGSASGYTGQAGAGAGKSHRSDDAESITDFTQQ